MIGLNLRLGHGLSYLAFVAIASLATAQGVGDLPAILVRPVAALSRVGGSAGFNVVADGGAPLSYQWMRDGAPLAGATRGFFTLSLVSAADAGSYAVRVTSAVGSVTSAGAILAVGPAPAVPIVDARFRADPRLDVPVTGSNGAGEATSAILPMPDGRVVIALATNDRTRILRLLPDGRIDPAFAESVVDSGSARLALLPDGGVMVARWGAALSGLDGDFFRLKEDGSRDLSFSLPIARASADGPGPLDRMLVQPDGKIVVMTWAGGLIRLLPNGKPDPEFQSPAVASAFAGTYATGGDIALVGNGSIYRAVPYDGLRRFLPNGEPDRSFVSPIDARSVGTNSFRLFTGADGRVVVDYVTWAGSGGTSIAIATGSIQLLANGETGISFSGETVLAAPAPDGTLLTRPSGYTARSPSSEAPNLTFWSAYGRAMEPTNVGVALPMTAYNSSYLAVFGPDSGLWLGGGFSFYNGVASPRVVRLNRVVSEVAAGPTLLGTWPESPTVTAGQAITLHAAANSDGPVTYEWNLNGDEEWVYSSDLRRTIEPSITFRPGRPGEQKWAVRARNSAGASVAGHGRFHAAAATLAIATQPTRISAAVGRNAELWVEASPGVPGVRAEWRRNGAVLATTQAAIRYGGEDGLSPMAAYVLNPVTITDAGTYTVTLSGSDGQTVTSAPIVVSVGDSPRISNFSVRARVGTGEAGAVVGLVIPPGRSRQVVIRGIGPALGGFGIAGALANSRLELYRSTQRLFVNDRWDATSAVSNRLFDSLGAFRLTAGSPDAAIFSSGLPDSRLVPGSYTVRLSDRDGVNGVGLMEIYEADLLSERLPNLSARVEAGGGADAAIVGWTIVGPGSKRLLVRAVGPTLSAFGVVGYSTNPRLELRDAAGALLAANDDWQSQGDSAGVAAAARSAGAFALAPGSRDAACVASLPAGGYSLVVTGSDARAGLALIEVFELP